MSKSKVATKKVKIKEDVPYKYSNSMVSNWENGREYYRKDDFNSLISAFKDWIYVCAVKNASSCASKGTFKLYTVVKRGKKLIVPTKDVNEETLIWLKSNPELQNYLAKAYDSEYNSINIKEILEHPFLTLVKSPNPFMDRYALLEMTDLFLELTGNAYWYIWKDKLGVPRQIWVIPSQNITIIPSKEKFIAGYVFRKGNEIVPFTTNEMIHFKFPNPHNLYYGMSPHASIPNELNTKENMDKFENALFSNNCRMEGVLETEFELSEATFKRVKEEWNQNYAGVNKAGKTAVLERGLKYKGITIPPKDLTNLQGRKQYREIVAGVYGVPMTMLTPEGSSLANSYIADRQYYTNTILPRFRRIEGVVNTRVLQNFDDSLFMSFDNPIPDDLEFELRKNVAEVKTGIVTVNEIRKKRGQPPVKWGDEPPQNNGAFAGAPISNNNAASSPD